jgi:hypothetical protein
MLTERQEADRALAARDTRIPALVWLLDDELLSALIGESVHIARTRYKAQTSALIAFRRGGSGPDRYGWALTMSKTADVGAKLQRRAQRSDTYGGGIRLFRPDPLQTDIVVAVGPIEDDWRLRPNLLWLRDHGLGRLGAPLAVPDRFLNGRTRVLRYKPERRLVVRVPSGTRPIVVKTAAQPYSDGSGLRLRQRLDAHGVPVLPELADAECAAHGISASPEWGDGDLGSTDNDAAAYRAGEALAAIHGVPVGATEETANEVRNVERQLAATRSMIAALLPELEAPATRLADRLLAQLHAPDLHGQPVLVHGDFSADQVLVRGSTVRIIDFDRFRTADPALDIGSFAAVEEITGHRPGGPEAGGRKAAHLIDGYQQAGGHVSRTGVDTWAAFRLFLGSVDPFRDRASAWPADTNWHIRRALELIP